MTEKLSPTASQQEWVSFPPSRSIKLNKWSIEKLAGAKGVVRRCFDTYDCIEFLYTWTTPSGEKFHEKSIAPQTHKKHFEIVLYSDANGKPGERIAESESKE
jgi:hypothetical protein